MPDTPTETVARRVRALRQGQFTAEQLAEAMAGLGIPWQRNVVANLENGRRDAVSVDELFALALILGVAPVALLVDIKAESAPVTPDIDVVPAELLLWLLGDADLPEPAPVTFTGPDVSAVRQLWRAWDLVRAGEFLADSGEPADDLPARRARLRTAAAELRRRDIRLPSVVADYLAEAER